MCHHGHILLAAAPTQKYGNCGNIIAITSPPPWSACPPIPPIKKNVRKGLVYRQLGQLCSPAHPSAQAKLSASFAGGGVRQAAGDTPFTHPIFQCEQRQVLLGRGR